MGVVRGGSAALAGVRVNDRYLDTNFRWKRLLRSEI